MSVEVLGSSFFFAFCDSFFFGEEDLGFGLMKMIENAVGLEPENSFIQDFQLPTMDRTFERERTAPVL